MSKLYNTKGEVFNDALLFMNKHLRDVMDSDSIKIAEQKLEEQGSSRKGYLGNLVEQYVFGQDINNRHEADFKIAGVELKTTPVKEHRTKGYVTKERLVFSMIDYMNVIMEDWEHSSFLDKNRLILLMFYLYQKGLSLLDYEFKFVYELDFVNKISSQDALQIKKDWEYIVGKIKKGEAHLLSEGETFYLGACTKAADSSVIRRQPNSDIPAKPRAFSLKQNYLNYILHEKIMGLEEDIIAISEVGETIDDTVKHKLTPFIGMSDKEILSEFGLKVGNKAKQYKRMLANLMLGVPTKKVEEFEKANVTMKVITLENSGKLKESISFPYFDYKEIIKQKWEDSDFYKVLEEDRFLFIIFKKDESGDGISFEGFKFWNFPVVDMPEAQKVWETTKKITKSGNYISLPKISDSPVSHVRPHGKNGEDKIETPQGTMEMKRCFWLNAD